MKALTCERCTRTDRRRLQYLCDQVPTSDGLPFRCCHSGTIRKLQMLKYYLEIFSEAMKDKYSCRNYLDLFCGPGLCRDRENGNEMFGSPSIALELKSPFTDYVFVDSSEQTFDILRKRCQKSIAASRPVIKFINVDANNDIDKVHNHLQELNSITVAFIDPNGLDIHWDTIRRLSKSPHLDIIINYALMDLKRNKNNYRAGNEKANLFFGGPDWPDNKFKRLSFYKEKLKSLGFTAVEDDGETMAGIKSPTGAIIYYLIYASKHNLGLKFWRAAKNKFMDRDLFNNE